MNWKDELHATPQLEPSTRLAGVAQEFLLACRLFKRQPGYSAVAVLMMALHRIALRNV